MSTAAIDRQTATEGTCHHVKEGTQGTSLDITDFNLWYGKSQALFDIDMSFQKGMVTALIGPSGCGSRPCSAASTG